MSLVKQPFAGDKKFGQSVLYPLEKRFLNWFIPKVPAWIGSYELTLMTFFWSMLVVVGSYLARNNTTWLWIVSLIIFLQYFTDLIDGALGRLRNTGLVKWGYYMDHLLDYLFLCSLLIGYSFFLAEAEKDMLFYILIVLAAFMINSFLSFAATNKFQITYKGIGPTELRFLFIAINSSLALFGTTGLGGALPVVLVVLIGGLAYVVFETQKQLFDDDMQAKKEKQS
jgi:phosphatidylglycerophosphate synthase